MDLFIGAGMVQQMLMNKLSVLPEVQMTVQMTLLPTALVA